MTPVVEFKGTKTQETQTTKVEVKPASLREKVRKVIEEIKNRKLDSPEYVYGIIMNSVKRVGNKTYTYVPVEYLIVDDRFQRCGFVSIDKICKLIANWDEKKMDALKGVPHPEDFNFSVVDGFHRLVAAIVMGVTGLEVELVLGLSENPQERLIQEATIFATQCDESDPVKPIQKHKADVLRGVPDAVIVDKLVKKYDISLNEDGLRGRAASKTLSGYMEARRIAKGSGESILNDVFYIIHESRWNLAYYGLGNIALRCLKNMLVFHPEHKQEVITELVEYCTQNPPKKLFASAMDKYPLRTETERNSLYLEDYLCEKIGITRTYAEKRKALKIA